MSIETLIKQYSPLYEDAKKALEEQIKTAQKHENYKERISGILRMSALGIFMTFFVILMLYAGNVAPAKAVVYDLICTGVLIVIFIFIEVICGFVFDESEKENCETQLKQLIAPADFHSAFDKLREIQPEEFASVSLIPAHYCVEQTVFAGIEPVMVGGKMLKGYKGGIVNLEADDLPPVLCSIRGENGPETKSALTYKYIFWDGPEEVGKTREAEYICISEEKFEDFPDEIRTRAVCVTLFPKFLGDNAWQFLILNPDAYDEIKAAMETLCVTVAQHIAETNAKAMLTRAIEEGSALYRPDDATLLAQDDIIACFRQKEDDGKTDGPLSDAFKAAEAMLAPSMLGFNIAAPAIEAQAPEIVVDSVTA